MPIVIGHRGASAAFPENTLVAFRGARALGADWVELDVWGTADGGLAVIHDAALPDGRAVTDARSVELPDDVPTLAEALVACEGMGVNVEVKSADPAAVVAVVRAWGGPVLVSSFHPATLVAVREVDADLPTALLTPVFADLVAAVDDAVAAGHVALNSFVVGTDRALIERCHDAGLAVYVWTVDDPARMAELIADGVDGIVTNVVDVARAVVDAANSTH